MANYKRNTLQPAPRHPLADEDINQLMEEYASKLEQKIAYESQYFRLMADAMPQIVWTCLPDGTVDYLNQRWYEYTGLEPSQGDLGKGWENVMHPEDREKNHNLWFKSMQTGAQYQNEYRLKDSSSGEYRWFLARALPGLDNKGEILKWFGTATDIDDHKKAQEKKDEFIAIASHELKTPVTSIKAFTQLLGRRLQRSGDNQSADIIVKMDGQINKLANLIRDLLDVSKIDSGKLELRYEQFDFGEFIHEVVENLKLISDKHTIELTGSAGGSVNADKDRIEQVVINLVSNAIKYSPRSDKVVINLCGDEENVKVGVQDFGVGIPKREQSKVFERFFRVGGAKRETFPGLGLGLFISFEIVKRQGGKMWVESQINKGSTFFFTLPAVISRANNK